MTTFSSYACRCLTSALIAFFASCAAAHDYIPDHDRTPGALNSLVRGRARIKE